MRIRDGLFVHSVTNFDDGRPEEEDAMRIWEGVFASKCANRRRLKSNLSGPFYHNS